MSKKTGQKLKWKSVRENQSLECVQAQEAFEAFQKADRLPIHASPSFKKNLREKLWNMLQDKKLH